MIGIDRNGASKDFGLLQVMPALLLIAALFFGGDWASQAADQAGAELDTHGQAMSIALLGSNAAMEVDFDLLAPTDGFVIAPAAIGESALVASELGAQRDAFRVEMRVTPIDERGFVRRVEVRVAFSTEAGAPSSVSLQTVRQDWNATHAETPGGDRKPLLFFHKPLTS